MPPPTGVVSGPLMPTRYFWNASTVSSGSQFFVWSNAFCPARTSFHWILRFPPYAFWTAASKTRTDARQMSGPVPSPSMNGMIGWSGTFSLPLAIEMVWPVDIFMAPSECSRGKNAGRDYGDSPGNLKSPSARRGRAQRCPAPRRSRRSLREPCPAELGGAGARIRALLGFVRDDHIRTDLSVDAFAQPAPERLLYPAILAAVEADDRGDAAGLQDVRQDGEQPIEVRQLAVHENAQRLERPRRGMQLRAGCALEREIPGLAHDGGELLRRRDGLKLPPLDDEPRDLRCVGFVPELQQRVREIALAHAREQRRCRLPARRIHPHVERPRPAVGEAARGIIDLRAGDADVGEDAVDALDPGLREHGRQRGEVVVEQLEVRADRGQRRLGALEVGRVEVDPDHAAARTDAPEQCGRMPAQADGAVDERLARLRVEHAQRRVEQHGDVAGVAFHLRTGSHREHRGHRDK